MVRAAAGDRRFDGVVVRGPSPSATAGLFGASELRELHGVRAAVARRPGGAGRGSGRRTAAAVVVGAGVVSDFDWPTHPHIAYLLDQLRQAREEVRAQFEATD